MADTTLAIEEAKLRGKDVGASLGWHLTNESERELVFTVGLNWRSWGEEVNVDFEGKGLVVHSKCRLFTQCVDYGKNAKNCEQFSKAYEV